MNRKTLTPILVIMLIVLVFFISGCGENPNENEVDYSQEPVVEDNTNYDESFMDTETYQAFNEATSLNLDSIKESDFYGMKSYSYRGINLELDESDVSKYLSGGFLEGKNFNQGLLYESLSRSVTDFNEHYPNGYEEIMGMGFWDVYSDVSEIIWGCDESIEVSVMNQKFKDAEELFASDGYQIVNIMKVFRECENVTGEISESTEPTNGEQYHIVIGDCSKLADELGITETALGYVLAELSEYSSDYEFYSSGFKYDLIFD